jgi:hypothetical protein
MKIKKPTYTIDQINAVIDGAKFLDDHHADGGGLCPCTDCANYRHLLRHAPNDLILLAAKVGLK